MRERKLEGMVAMNTLRLKVDVLSEKNTPMATNHQPHIPGKENKILRCSYEIKYTYPYKIFCHHQSLVLASSIILSTTASTCVVRYIDQEEISLETNNLMKISFS